MAPTTVAREHAAVRCRAPLGSTWMSNGGTCYSVVGHCVVVGHQAAAVLCRGEQGVVWCYPAVQFLDGRFRRAGEACRPTADTKAHDVTPADVPVADLT